MSLDPARCAIQSLSELNVFRGVQLLGKQGWKMIAMYRDREDGRQGGRFLAFNILRCGSQAHLSVHHRARAFKCAK